MKGSSDHTSGERVRKLLENHHPSRVFQLLAENMLQSDHPVETQFAPTDVENQPRKIAISREKLRLLRNESVDLVRIPVNEYEARRLVQEWKKGERVRTEDLVGMILFLKQVEKKQNEKRLMLKRSQGGAASD